MTTAMLGESTVVHALWLYGLYVLRPNVAYVVTWVTLKDMACHLRTP